MCDVLQLPRSTSYYESKVQEKNEYEITARIVQSLYDSRQTYGTRKIKVELQKHNWVVSRRRIGWIVKEQGLVSKYTVALYKPTKSSCNESRVANVLDRAFEQDEELKVVVSDLTYVRVRRVGTIFVSWLSFITGKLSDTAVDQIRMSSLLLKRSLVKYDLRKIHPDVSYRSPSLASFRFLPTVFRS